MSKATILVTGAAGFVGAFLTQRLLETTESVVIGFDNLNDYYDVRLKEDRLQMLKDAAGDSGRFVFVRGDLADADAVDAVFREHRPSIVVNLAAQAGVRYSIENPRAYIDSNLIGFFNILEACRAHPVEHLVYASSSSVYGTNEKVPYSTSDQVDNPVSLYAATKKSNELMAHSYASLYGIPSTGLRFFTVYGPMGRPDMAYFKFTDKIVRGEPIQIYNMGDMRRDFTYIDDIVTGVVNVMGKAPDESATGVRHKVYNIGNNQPESLLGFVETLERVLIEEGVISEPTKHELLPMQPGDVYQTYADVDELKQDFGFRPSTPLRDGLAKFARWYATSATAAAPRI
ncbi:NAD-dependent epimerase/dehydratase family protein [Aeromicrobium sp. YIM 150415]|uniref:NAD-dependent epimerase/dehydratase family protein n=1 Tax=Aeromicrobium sp. YIM 150415 TaxID=2803912 RepID=UPI0019639415|nr:NAD-dependent epimerase/dehydratase family protein [Aeromicrobium sp. YIM 150415]MBM9463420.1 NAD-dependent epimerase/dehydratase family protein [Aeromicrobium sp. YIM 150415]